MPAMRPVRYSTLTRVFELDGWIHHRTSGDHFVYVKPGFKRPVVIPKWDEVPIFIIQNNLRTAGMSRERYFELLAQT
ncbi:MAG: type II toxin-antitoxin system HicA family toxin [Acidobacteriota bacterium]